MKIFGQILGVVLLLCGASYAHADIIFNAPSGTGDNVLFNQQPNNQRECPGRC